jgi:hypothetical protein
MDDPLRIIRYLYGEDVDDPTFRRRLTEDGSLYREYEQLRQTKEDLDRRPSRRPDPAVVDEVVETARTAAQASPAPSHPTEDRPARPPSRTWNRRLQMTGAALALVLMVGLGWWQVPGASEESTAVSTAETAQRSTPTAAEGRAPEADAVPEWDDGDELVRIHRRIERLQAHSRPDSWGTLQTVSRSRP